MLQRVRTEKIFALVFGNIVFIFLCRQRKKAREEGDGNACQGEPTSAQGGEEAVAGGVRKKKGPNDHDIAAKSTNDGNIAILVLDEFAKMNTRLGQLANVTLFARSRCTVLLQRTDKQGMYPI